MRFLRGRLVRRLRIKNRGWLPIFGAALIGLFATGIAVAAITLSNLMTFGPVQVGYAVQLSRVQDISSTVTFGQQSVLKYEMKTTQAVAGASVLVHVRATGINLTDPTVVQVAFQDVGANTFSPVALTSDGTVLNGTLKSGWNVAAGYDSTASVGVTFLQTAPSGSYYIDVETTGTASGGSGSSPTPTPVPSGVSYSATIQPIFNASCTVCHGTSAGVTLTSYSTTMGSNIVVVGNATNSLLYKAVTGNGVTRMPMSAPLTAAQIQSIADWINQGALNN